MGTPTEVPVPRKVKVRGPAILLLTRGTAERSPDRGPAQRSIVQDCLLGMATAWTVVPGQKAGGRPRKSWPPRCLQGVRNQCGIPQLKGFSVTWVLSLMWTAL